MLVYADPAEANLWGLNDADLGSLVAAADDRDLELGRSQDDMIAAWLEEWAGHQDRDPDGGLHIGDWIRAQLAHVVGPARASASRLRRWDLPAQ